MIDTLVIHQTGENRQHFDLNLKKLKSLYDDENKTSRYFRTFYEHPEKKKAPVYIEYVPSYSVEQGRLKVQFSAPKILTGNSIENLELSGLSELQDTLEKRLKGVLNADFNNMRISRLDICKSMDMGEETGMYLLACDNARTGNGRYASYRFGNETVTFTNASRRITFYDKVKECLALDRTDALARHYQKAGKNILRYEIQHKGSKSISRHLKKNDLSIETLYRHSNKMKTEFSMYLTNEFRKFFGYTAQYEMFREQTGIIYAVNSELGKRNLILKVLTKMYLLEHLQDFKPNEFVQKFYKIYSNRNIAKARKLLNRIEKIGKMTKNDLFQEIEMKLVA